MTRPKKKTPAQILRKWRRSGQRLKRFSEFTRLNVVERMALECFEALQEALGSRR